MTFAEVAEAAFETGPKCLRGYSKFASRVVSVGMFITYFGACSAYTLIISGNVSQMVRHYFGASFDIRLYLLMISVPIILISFVPNLKYLAPVSMVANILCALGLSITVYYLVRDLPPIGEVEMVRSIRGLPTFFSITIFALEAIGIMMPLENNMKNPRNMLGPMGVMNRGAIIVTIIYLAVGFFGYWQFGDITEDNITANLSVVEMYAGFFCHFFFFCLLPALLTMESFSFFSYSPAQLVKVFITLAVFFSFGLQIMVCIEVLWGTVGHRYPNHPTIANYVTR